MLFNSYQFIFAFLPVVFAGFFVVGRYRREAAALWLVGASLFFYGYWNPAFLPVLLVSIFFNYSIALGIGRTRTSARRSIVLCVGIIINLSALGFFKYLNFLLDTANSLGGNTEPLNIILPLGISFFTFTQIAFIIDVARGVASEEKFLHYVLFVTWFPHLIAGPVLHHKQMMPQFADKFTYRPNRAAISVGLTFFCIGLFKKVILADQFAEYANPVFKTASPDDGPQLFSSWLAALAYTLQLYFDFSGYSDMAIGISRLFNVKLPLNFNSPYKAVNIIEFWRRWHMTLSQFLRDYLYLPLGGNRKGTARRYVNLLLTMLLGGLWHGAGWTFVLWGGLHGMYLIINHAWRYLRRGRVQISDEGSAAFHALPSILLTFAAVVFAWIPFRAPTIDITVAIWKGMLGLNGVSLPRALAAKAANLTGSPYLQFNGFFPGLNIQVAEAVTWILSGLLIIWALPNAQEWLRDFDPSYDRVIGKTRFRWTPIIRYGVATGLLGGISFVSLNRLSAFLYFQF